VKFQTKAFGLFIHVYIWVRAVVTIALLAQWGRQRHAVGYDKAMGSIPKNLKKYFTRIFIPYRNDQGKFFGVYIPSTLF
jgi:hypothetical protein